MASAPPRPVSAAVHNSSPAQNPSSTARRQQRASHSVASSSQQQSAPPDDSNSPYTDVYSHSAVVAYMAAHPRRTIPRFGPYLLLQTLGEGEFGKVKLGIHVQWGEEVAVKLIRRGNVDNAVRLSKVEREIEVLRTLKHPNIVRLYDVIETDKYIGIILEYASGGELFDHILAHRYLKEKDAAKLFSQLISGVWYIHQKKIVHRDLKLENLLLDRHRNVIITDFGFANRFEHKADDLMQTSCGSPCYAAPELVINEGLYVGSAVDIWSCGVILYAMLAGYLPFDDDPANPDGDNINLLYKYIVSTPLSFPDYISADARDLLSMMLVPDPTRRANLDGVMRHRWLSAHAGTPRTDGSPNAFGKSVDELERAALDQHQQRRLAYQRQMRAAAIANTVVGSNRSHGKEATHPGVPSRSRSAQPEYLYESSAEQSMLQSASSPGKTAVPSTPNANGSVSGKKATYGSPSAHGITSDDPFGPGPQSISATGATATVKAPEEASKGSGNGTATLSETKGQSPPKGHKTNNSGGASGFRHTIQVEYDEPRNGRRSDERRSGRPNTDQNTQLPLQVPAQQTSKDRRTSSNNSKPLPVSPNTTTGFPKPTPAKTSTATTTTTATRQTTLSPGAPQQEIPTLSISTPATPDTTTHSIPSDTKERDKETGSQTSGTSSSKKGHKKGRSSLDKFNFVKIFSGGNNTPTPMAASPVVDSLATAVPAASPAHSEASSIMNTSFSPDGKGKEGGKEKEGKKSRRNTLTVMVEPISRTIRGRSGKNKSATTPGPISADPSNASAASLAPPPPMPAPHNKTSQSAVSPSGSAGSYNVVEGDVTGGSTSMPASTSKARKVMAWFRTKSKGRDSMGVVDRSSSRELLDDVSGAGAAADSDQVPMNPSQVQLTLTTPTATTTKITNVPRTPAAPGHPKRSASSATESSFSTPGFVQKFRNSVTVGGSSGSSKNQQQHQQQQQHPHGQLRIHHGAVDQTTITTRSPPEVMKHVREILDGMGVEISVESAYKYRCVRAKKKKGVVGVQPTQIGAGGQKEGDVAAFTMVGSAASNGVDKRGLPIPSQTSFGATGNMLRGLLMRRQSSQTSAISSTQPNQPTPSAGGGLAFDDDNSVVVSPSTPTGDGIPPVVVIQETTYGDATQDAGDEVRFSVELTRIDRLNDTFSLDIRRLKGNLRSYKFLYDTIRQRADLQR